MKLAILIPAYNEEKMLARVIKTLPKKLPRITQKEIVVIDDGSKDKTAEIAKRLDVTVISHLINRGLGGALGTGFEYAKKKNFDCLVTFDADGQHNPKDIEKILKPILAKKADVVIGSRLKNRNGMPWYRQVGIFGLNIFTLIFFWVWTSDSQSGLRAFSKKAIQEIEIASNKMEVSSEIFNEIGKKELKMVEVPIKSIYTDYSLKKGVGKGQIRHGIGIITKLIYRRFFAK
jgi:glycosyltransferase involved in cell wall biosynthesis